MRLGLRSFVRFYADFIGAAIDALRYKPTPPIPYNPPLPDDPTASPTPQGATQ